MKIWAVKWTVTDDKNPEVDMSGISLHSTKKKAVDAVFADAIFDNLDDEMLLELRQKIETDLVLSMDDDTLFVTVNEIGIDE